MCYSHLHKEVVRRATSVVLESCHFSPPDLLVAGRYRTISIRHRLAFLGGACPPVVLRAASLEFPDVNDQPASEEVAANPAIGTYPFAALTDATDRPPPGALVWEKTYGDYTLRCYAGGLSNEEYVAAGFEIWQRDALV